MRRELFPAGQRQLSSKNFEPIEACVARRARRKKTLRGSLMEETMTETLSHGRGARGPAPHSHSNPMYREEVSR